MGGVPNPKLFGRNNRETGRPEQRVKVSKGEEVGEGGESWGRFYRPREQHVVQLGRFNHTEWPITDHFCLRKTTISYSSSKYFKCHSIVRDKIM